MIFSPGFGQPVFLVFNFTTTSSVYKIKEDVMEEKI